MISGSKEQLKQELEYTLLKPDCNSLETSLMILVFLSAMIKRPRAVLRK